MSNNLDQAVMEMSDDVSNYQRFDRANGKIVRTINFGGEKLEGETSCKGVANFRPEIGWYLSRLRGNQTTWNTGEKGTLRILDMFSGAGGLSLGAAEAARAAGWKYELKAAMDVDATALKVHKRNLKTKLLVTRDIQELIDYQIWKTQTGLEFSEPPEALYELESLKGKVDLIIAGPPCQGHSNLNNHTRRVDDRNRLYLTVPAVAAATGANLVVIENVQGVLKDKHNVVGKTVMLLESLGFEVANVLNSTLKAEQFGVPQLRRRHFLVASRYGMPKLNELAGVLETSPITALQAISGISKPSKKSLFDENAELSIENHARVNFLHDNDLYDLPNTERPDCHKDGHTYPSVYGRIYPDKPANTLTTGFLSPGRGRFIHPTERRGLTPHEAARLQGFPDDFKFETAPGRALSGNGHYSKIIGDAVPPLLGFVPALAAILTKGDSND